MLSVRAVAQPATWDGQCVPSELARLIASDAIEHEHVGECGAFSGDTALLGAPAKSVDDVDGVNGFDVQPLRDLLNGVGWPCLPCAADVNTDGSVDSDDIAGLTGCLTPG